MIHLGSEIETARFVYRCWQIKPQLFKKVLEVLSRAFFVFNGQALLACLSSISHWLDFYKWGKAV